MFCISNNDFYENKIFCLLSIVVSKGGMSVRLYAKLGEGTRPWKGGGTARSQAELKEGRARLRVE